MITKCVNRYFYSLQQINFVNSLALRIWNCHIGKKLDVKIGKIKDTRINVSRSK